MMRRVLCLTAVAALTLASGRCASSPADPRPFPGGSSRTPPPRLVDTPSAIQPVALPATVQVRIGGRIERVALEDYVVGTALAEVSPISEAPATVDRVFDVQAILARTYAAANVRRHAAEGFDLCDGTHCQVYQPDRRRTSRFSAVAAAAAARTQGQVVVFRGQPAGIVFHADCGGHTAPSTTAWNGPMPSYLTGGKDDVPTQVHQTWTADLTAKDLDRALARDPRTDVRSAVRALTVLARDASGRALRVRLTGATDRVVSGEVLRAVLNSELGDRMIRSTRFTLRRTDQGWHVVGTGFGHGVGLCQVGAAARARRGDRVTDILRSYYPGTTLSPAT